MLKLLVICIPVSVLSYMFIAERFKGSPTTQIKQALGIKEKEDPAVEAEVEEMTTKFGLSVDQQRVAKEMLDQEKQEIAAVLKDRSLTKQQQSEKIIKIQKHSHGRIAFWLTSDKEEGKKIEEWLMSRESNVSDANSP
jgi:hypothetical protein